MKIRQLTNQFAVSSQIKTKQVQALADAGFVAIINNRPDGEMWGQPKGEEIKAAAAAAGMEYFHIPISLHGLDMAMIDQMKQAQDATKGKIISFCASGTRAANVWGLSQAKNMSADDIIAAGLRGGYNLEGLRTHLGG